MRQVAVFHEKIKDYAGGAIRVEPAQIQSFTLNQVPVTTGLLDTVDTAFDPLLPQNRDKVLVRKKAFSCNYRDKALALKAKRGVDIFASKSQARFFTLGSEFVGEVVAVGAGVDTLKVGDRVIGNASYPFSGFEDVLPGLPTNQGSKELEVFHFSKLVSIPANMSDEVAAGFALGGQTAYSMIRKLNLRAGEKVLVTAATSNTSLFAISALKNLPVKVYALTTREEFAEKLRALGAEEVFVIPRGMQSLLDDSRIKHFTQEEGLFQAVIDPFFDVYLRQVINVIDFEGRYTTCGMYAQPGVGEEAEIDKLPNNLLNYVMSWVMVKNIQLIGNCIGRTHDLERAIQDYTDGKLEVIIDTIFQQDQAGEFFERSFNARDRFGKVVLSY